MNSNIPIKKLKPIISPSMLSCDLGNLESECKRMVDSGADWLHLDVIDGLFAPNITFGFPVIKSIRNKVSAFFDCHCMITDPYKYVEEFSKCGADQMTFHVEAQIDSLEKLILKIKENKMRVGVAVKPDTFVDHTITKYLDQNMIDMILIMSVQPGFSGQKFIEDVLPKVEDLRKNYPELDIQMDGGVCCENIDRCAKAGANIIVAGSGVFCHENPPQAISYMREIISRYI